MGTQLKMGRCQMRNFVVNFSGTTVVAQHLTGVALCAFSALHVLFPLYNSVFLPAVHVCPRVKTKCKMSQHRQQSRMYCFTCPQGNKRAMKYDPVGLDFILSHMVQNILRQCN